MSALEAGAAGDSGAAVHRAGAAPAWVDVMTPDYAAPVPPGDVVDSVHFLLVDRQIDVRARGDERYQHYAVRLISETGAEDRSQLTLYVDPSFQRLTLHWVRVFRDGQLSDRLASARITALPVETDLQSRVYSGEQSVNLLIADLRAGDVLEYAYSTESVSPSFPEHFSALLDYSWSEPVYRQRIRVRHLPDDPVQYKAHGGSAEPVVRTRNGHRELEFTWHDLPALRGESDVPDWYPMWAFLEFSDMADWQTVAARTHALYERQSRPGALTKARIEKLRAVEGTDAERVLAALRMVQDEIRYASISIGPGSFIPNPPDLVLERNFGDCKDKSLLLVSLLRANGIDAKLALVDSRRGNTLPDLLPTPRAFDHAIVRVGLGPRVIWVDPTMRLQRGTVEKLTQADFGHALVVDPRTESLEAMPKSRPEAWGRDVKMIFDLKAGLEKPATLEIRSRFSGRAADWLRSDIANRNRSDREKDYLNYYAGYYPSIQVSAPFAVEDDPLENVIETVERYKLARGFETRDDDVLVFEIYPDELYGYADTTTTPIRTAPLAQAYPAKVAQSIEVRLPEAWPVKTGTFAVNNPAFRYSATTRYRKEVLSIDYRFESLTDFVPLERVPKYLADIKRMSDDLGYELTYDRQFGSARSDLAAYPLLASMLGLLAGIWIAVRFTLRYDPPPRPVTPGVVGAPVGIAGWLVIPALNVILLTGLTCVNLYMLLTYASEDVWQELPATAAASIAGWAQHGVAAMLLAGFLLIPSVLVIAVNFFRKRSSAPLLAIWLFWGIVAYTAIAGLLTNRLMPVEDEGALPAWVDFIRDLVFLLIWTRYLRVSEHVRATFVRRRSPEIVVAAPGAAEAVRAV